MKDRWNYRGLGQVKYGHDESYAAACGWLDQPGWLVEDWGCGCAHAKRYFKRARYLGIDGSQNNYADICREDITTRDSRPDGILLRHVLEHNEGWQALLDNAIRCFQKRLVLVFFIDFGPETRVINVTQDPKYPGVKDIQFKRQDILDRVGPFLFYEGRYGPDTLLFCEKKTIAENRSGLTVAL